MGAVGRQVGGANEAVAALGLQHHLELGEALLVPLPPLVVEGPAAHHVAGGRLADLPLGVALRPRRVGLPLVGQVAQDGQVALLAGHGGAGGEGQREDDAGRGDEGAASAPSGFPPRRREGERRVRLSTPLRRRLRGCVSVRDGAHPCQSHAAGPCGERLSGPRRGSVGLRRHLPGQGEHALPKEGGSGASRASAGPSPRCGAAEQRGPQAAGARPGGELEFRSQRRRVGGRSSGSSSNGKTKWLLHKRK